MDELIKAYHEMMKKYELVYEKIRVHTDELIKRELDSREEQVSELKEMHWAPRLEEKMIKTIVDGSEKLILKYREDAEETIEHMRKKDSALTASLLGIPDPLADS